VKSALFFLSFKNKTRFIDEPSSPTLPRPIKDHLLDSPFIIGYFSDQSTDTKTTKILSLIE